jgi:hypothetical protein
MLPNYRSSLMTVHTTVVQQVEIRLVFLHLMYYSAGTFLEEDTKGKMMVTGFSLSTR